MLDVKKMTDKLTAEKFKENNGTVMRAVSIGFPVRWFEFKELKIIVSDQMGTDELRKALVYICDENYLKFREKGTGKEVDIMDADFEELEFRVSPKGTRLIECIEDDPMIDM